MMVNSMIGQGLAEPPSGNIPPRVGFLNLPPRPREFPPGPPAIVKWKDGWVFFLGVGGGGVADGVHRAMGLTGRNSWAGCWHRLFVVNVVKVLKDWQWTSRDGQGRQQKKRGAAQEMIHTRSST